MHTARDRKEVVYGSRPRRGLYVFARRFDDVWGIKTYRLKAY